MGNGALAIGLKLPRPSLELNPFPRRRLWDGRNTPKAEQGGNGEIDPNLKSLRQMTAPDQSVAGAISASHSSGVSMWRGVSV